MGAMKLHRVLSLLAIGIWLASLALPTLNSVDGIQPGLFVLREGAAGMLFFFMAPLHLLSWCTNFGFWACALVVLFQKPTEEALILLRFLYCALAVNIGVGLIFGRSTYSGPGRLPDLLALPGFYAWVLSFVVMALAVKLARSQSETD